MGKPKPDKTLVKHVVGVRLAFLYGEFFFNLVESIPFTPPDGFCMYCYFITE